MQIEALHISLSLNEGPPDSYMSAYIYGGLPMWSLPVKFW